MSYLLILFLKGALGGYSPASQKLFWFGIGFYLFVRFMNLWTRYDKKRAIEHLEDRISNLEKRNEMREVLGENKN